MLSHFGVFASSKSAMNTLAPELSALMIILRSTGPVISTRRSSMSAGTGAQVQCASRIARVSAQEIGALAGVELALPRAAAREQLRAPAAEGALQPRHERHRLAA